MNERGLQIAATVAAIAGVRALIVDPCVHWLHRKGVLKGPVHPPFFSLLVRWRNIGIFLAFFVVWIGGILLLGYVFGG